MQTQFRQPSQQPTAPTDSELLARFRQGDQLAFVDLVRRWETALGRIAYRITGDVSTAEDVRQIVLLRLLESHDKLHKPRQVAAWLRSCAVNVAITELRRRNRHQRAGAKLAENCSHTVASEPTDLMTATEEAAQLRKALAALAPDQRALLSLRFDEVLTFREIADTLERPVSTVKSQIRTAIERLRTLLIPAHERGGDDGQR